MNKPSKYKSIDVVEVKNRTVLPLTNTQKIKVLSILTKLTSLMKNRHS